MPTVPRIDQQQISLDPIRAPQLSTTAPIEAFGGGGTLAGTKALNDLSKLATEIAIDEKKKADDIVATDVASRALKAKNELLWNKDTGAFTKKGKASFGVIDDFTPLFDVELDKIEKDLSNNDQRRNFQGIRVRAKTDFNDQLTKHIFKESRTFDETVTRAGIKASQEEAILYYQDPGKIDESIEGIENLIDSHGSRNFLPQDEINNRKKEAVSATHKGVIHRMLANGNDQQASRYFKEKRKKGEISGFDVKGLEGALKEGSLRGESQRRVDRIMETAKNEEEALARARNVTDPKLEDDMVRRLKERFNERAASRKNHLNNLYQQSVNVIDASPNQDAREVIDPHTWSNLTLPQRKALEARSNNPKNDNRAWLEFLSLDQSAIADLNLSDFDTTYWSKFDSSHRSRAESMWKDARKSQQRGIIDPKLTAVKNFNTRVVDNLRAHGILGKDVSKKNLEEEDLNRYLLFEEEAQTRLNQFELNKLGGKRKATPAEQQQVLDELLKQKIMIDDWGFDSEKFIIDVKADEQGDAYVPIKEIPIKRRDKVENRIRFKGKIVTKDKVQRAYAADLLGNYTLRDSIINE